MHSPLFLTKNWVKLVVALSIVGALASACAREQSEEDRSRELRERKIERLAKAEGKFSGSITTANGGAIPFALTVTVNRNPEQGADEPGLTARIRLGLFGGVDLTTDTVSFDYGTGDMTAAFKGEGPDTAKALELQAEVTDGGLKAAQLNAASGKSYVVTAAATPDLNLAEPSVELIYGIRIEPTGGNGVPVDAVLSLSRRTGAINAPASSDMPRLPQIEGSLRFPGAARVAHIASSIEYDALTDTLDVFFPGGNGMRLAFVGISDIPDGAPLTFVSQPNLIGTAELGSRTVGTVVISPDQLQLIEKSKITQLPSKNYTGTYVNGAGREIKVVANTIYMGSEGDSGSATPFSRFPKLRLQISTCLGGTLISTRKLALSSVDYFSSEATFVPEAGVGDRGYATYKDAWNQLDIQFVDDSDTSGASATMYRLIAVGGESDRLLTCADTRSAPETLFGLMGLTGDDELEADDAPLLTYEGYLTRNNGSAVPLSMAIYPRQNPGGGSDEPSLQVTARIGFFGGANIASEPAVFNWGSGRISAVFLRPGGAPLELRGYPDEDAFREGILAGPNLGQNTLVAKRGAEPYTSNGQEAVFNVAIGKGTGPVAPEDALQSVLTLRSRSEGTTAPASIDLPVLPSIDASLRIDGLAQTPQVGTKIIYDVLRGTMEVSFSDASTLEFNNIFLQPTNVTTRPFKPFTSLGGRLIMGGQTVGTAAADDVTVAGRWPLQNLPYTYYIGTFQSQTNGNALKALARIAYPGSAGRNTAEYPFQTFPNLLMTVSVCVANTQISSRELELEAVDYLERGLVFKNRSNGTQNAMNLEFSPGWGTLTGEIRDADGSSGDTQGSRLRLTALPNATSVTCSTPQPTP